MSAELRDRIVEYMGKCRSCTVATATADGQPSASTVFFKNSGLDVYFNTARHSQKVRNIEANPRVAVTMQAAQPAFGSDKDIKGVQYTGRGRVLSDEEAREVPKAVMARHKAFNSAMPGKAVIVRLTPERVYFIDYSLGFRHRDVLEL